MHHNEFNLINEIGVIELGSSPIFNVPSDFKVKYESGRIETVPLEKDYIYLLIIPFFLFILSTIWLFAKPQQGFQWMMFGYFNMIVIPIVLITLVLQILNYMNGIGMYEIDISGLDLPST